MWHRPAWAACREVGAAGQVRAGKEAPRQPVLTNRLPRSLVDQQGEAAAGQAAGRLGCQADGPHHRGRAGQARGVGAAQSAIAGLDLEGDSAARHGDGCRGRAADRPLAVGCCPKTAGAWHLCGEDHRGSGGLTLDGCRHLLFACGVLTRFACVEGRNSMMLTSSASAMASAVASVG